MLTRKEILEIDEAVRHYAEPQAAALDALRIIQRQRGWVSDESLADLAAFIGVSPAGLDAVATFYNRIYRKPVGKHVILVCDSVSCWIMGYNPLREHLTARLGINLGQTTFDNRFTLLPTACLGVCEQAPAMLIDGNVHGNLTTEKLDDILAQYR